MAVERSTQGSSRTSPDPQGSPERTGLRKVVAASMAGTIVEWYEFFLYATCLLYTSPSPRDLSTSRMPSSA